MDVLVVGDANPDLLLSGDVVPAVRPERADGRRGAHARRLGRDRGDGAGEARGAVGLAAALGADELGEITAARLEGVDPSALQRTALPTGLSVHLLDGDDRTILTRRGAIGALDVAAACAKIAGVRHVHIASVFLIPALAERGGEVLEAARAAGATVSVDTNFDPAASSARRSGCWTPTRCCPTARRRCASAAATTWRRRRASWRRAAPRSR